MNYYTIKDFHPDLHNLLEDIQLTLRVTWSKELQGSIGELIDNWKNNPHHAVPLPQVKKERCVWDGQSQESDSIRYS